MSVTDSARLCSFRLLTFMIFSFSLFACVLMGAHHSVYASPAGVTTQDAQKTENIPSNQSEDIETLEKLIVKLESESGRSALISDLNSLKKVLQERSADEKVDIVNMLPLDAAAEDIVEELNDTLTEVGIEQSTLINALLTVLVLLLMLGLKYIHKRGVKFTVKKLVQLRNKLQLPQSRFNTLVKCQKVFGYVIILVTGLYILLEIWDVSPSALDQSLGFVKVIESLLSGMVVVMVAAAFWDLLNTFIELEVYRNRRLQTSRAKTFIPILRNIILFVVIVLTSLTILSELGVDIVPLLAGAGVFGIAVGFGAQTLVKDFLTGFTIILEDLLQIGDVVKVADRIGFVEKITIRKIQLRALDGVVHTVPFGEVSIVDNLTKDYSYYLMDIGISYREDVDEVIQCIKEISEEMKSDEAFSDQLLEPVEIMGLDRFEDSAVIVRARLKTVAGEQWYVGREFNKRIKVAFDRQGIEIPFPHQTIYFGEQKSGLAPPANVQYAQST